METAIYDAVLICNGQYSEPLIPDYPGMNEYGGVQIHSHDYRSVDRFKGKGLLGLTLESVY